MALKIKELKKELENTCPLFTDRVKGDWDELAETVVTVNGAMIYTDSNGDTYGVITVEEVPGTFYLCGSVATKIVEAVCNPENGGEFDDSGVMTEKFKLLVGEKKQSKDKAKSPYRVVKLIDEDETPDTKTAKTKK